MKKLRRYTGKKKVQNKGCRKREEDAWNEGNGKKEC